MILSAFPIRGTEQIRNERIENLLYRKVTATPAEAEAKPVRWERPILHGQIEHPQLGLLHAIDFHLTSRLASTIPGQRDRFLWKTSAGWAEGYFFSSMKRVGQALETRMLIDEIFDNEEDARILVCGDFNAEPGEVAVEATCGRVEDTNNPDLGSRVLIPCSNRVPSSTRFSHLHQ